MNKSNISITQLEYVLAVDKHKHFKKAAKECNVTQPTLSMQISKLENDIGTILFDRSKSPILTTEEGKLIVGQARAILREYKKLYETVAFSKGNLTGQIKLGIIPTLSPYLLPIFAESFSNEYPEIELSIDELKTDEILEKLERDELDVGLLVTPLEGASFIERALYYEPFVLFFSPDHPLLSKDHINEGDIKLRELWLLKEGHCFRSQVLNICGPQKIESKKNSNLKFESGSLETLKNMVTRGSGYTLLPQMMVSSLSEKEKKLIRPFHSKRVPTREVSLIHGRIFLKEKLIDLLEEQIIKNLPEEIRSLKKDNLHIVDLD